MTEKHRGEFPFQIALISLIAALNLFSQPDKALAADTKLEHKLTVSGSGEVSVKPDKAEITIGVVTENKSAQSAYSSNSEAAQKVQTALGKAGITAENIQTANFGVQPITNQTHGPLENAKPEIVGYRVYNQMRVTIRDITQIGSVLDATAQAGANNIEGIAFMVSSDLRIQDQAMEQAVRNARHKAETIAHASGMAILGISEITEGNPYRPGPILFRAAAQASTPISPGQMTFIMTVTIVYQIGPEGKAAAVRHSTRNAKIHS